MDRFQLGLEIALSVLLLVTIFYSLYLGRALVVIRRDRGQLDALIMSLESSSAQAQSGIDHLRQTTEMVGRALGKTVETGKTLKNELTILCERSEAVAQVLEGGVSAQKASSQKPIIRPEEEDVPGARMPLRPRMDEGRMGSVGTVKTPVGKSAAERELLRALRQRQG
ncbi:DUF6468 domain-containing protein [Gluconobacter japonicus]|uniref:DUF6468 domain-containing protein n=1 Tax=Gluconobacter japonicus TaxID=376620 RepID=A0ABQ5WHA2_GLUJA|nr:DUF6468 domain-containing protein [Gluconobacter japonicus]KXV27117.1 hypothetical protein AD938_07965 [Gluconobacter japonicus]GBR26049.1 hypothetical protein AA3271_2192 [Gluconobacter japonicus NBRC 3271]GLQ59223.1 hypothetical protein GCM10010937_10260 [Gluconobacter japonicus]